MKDVTTTGDLSKVELRNRRWHVESTGSTEPPISPELVRIRLQTCLSPILLVQATPLTPDSVLTTSPDLSSPPARLWPGEEAVFSCRSLLLLSASV